VRAKQRGGKLLVPDISRALDAAYGVTIESKILGDVDGFWRQFNSVQSEWDKRELCRQLPDYKLLNAYTSMLNVIYFEKGELRASNICRLKVPNYTGKALEKTDIVEFIHVLNPQIKINVAVEYLKENFTKGKASSWDWFDERPNIDVAGLCHEMKMRFRYVEICVKKGLKTLVPDANLQDAGIKYHLRSRNILS